MMLGDAIMAKWWMGLALAAVVAGQQQAALAQVPMATPEPAPCGPSTAGQNSVYGPLPANLAPPGPCPDLSLPSNSKGAFDCVLEATHPEFYIHVGAIALQRGRLGHGEVSFLDPGNGLDTGIRPTLFKDINNTTLDYSAYVPAMQWGATATIGYAVEDWAFEVSGFFIPEVNKTKTIINKGKLDLPFINPPLGFEGDNGLWLQADRVGLSDRIQLTNAEFNFRYASRAIAGIEPLIGIRYFDLNERLGIFTDDDGLSFPDVNGFPDPTREATYTVGAHSHIIAPQLGGELQVPIYPHLALDLVAKGAWGANFYNQTVTLSRGDGYTAINSHTSHTQFTHMYEIGANLDIYLLERFRVRGGYNLFWIVNVPEAKDQVNFDLSQPLGNRSDHGSIFFHGPRVEMQFLF
jgi:hypothetical protein